MSGPIRSKKGQTLLSSRLQPISYKNMASAILGRPLPYFFLDEKGHGALASTPECVGPLVGEVESRLETFGYWNGSPPDPSATVLLMVSISIGREFWPENLLDVFGPVLHERETAQFMRKMRTVILCLENRLAPFFGGVVSFVDLYVSFGNPLPVVQLLVMPVDSTGGLEFEKYLSQKKREAFFKICGQTFSDLATLKNRL